MENINKIFNQRNIEEFSNAQSALFPTFRKDRINLLNQSISNDMNTYRNWELFDLMIEPNIDETPISGSGLKSLFNNNYAVIGQNKLRDYLHIPLLDTNENRRKIRKDTDCSIKSLVKSSQNGSMGVAVYSFADFMYCKNLGKVANNHLITLRRFPIPCGDHITRYDINDTSEDSVQQHMPEIGHMITWLGTSGNEMENILKYDFNMDWQEMTSKIEEIDGLGDTPQGPLGKFFAMTNPNYLKDVQAGTAGQQMSFASKFFGKSKFGTNYEAAPYSNAQWLRNHDEHRVYGPLDTINSTYVKGDKGLSFNQEITLNFDYELRSYDGINSKSAMLDLIGNILSVTHTTGKFWGGSRKYYGASTNNVFTNLSIFKDAQKGSLNSFTNIRESFTKSLGELVKGNQSGGTGGNIMDTIKNVAGNVLGALTGGLLNSLGRPQKYALTSLLSPAPTGLWHVTIGNPKNPILTMGNMIVTNTSIQHYGPLGLDDFPTGLKVSVTLKHAMPRENTSIEQMYLSGDNRIYTIIDDKKFDKVYKKAKGYKELVVRDTINGREVIPNKKDARKVTNENDNSLLKYFGTKNIGNIKYTIKEAGFGGEQNKNSNK